MWQPARQRTRRVCVQVWLCEDVCVCEGRVGGAGAGAGAAARLAPPDRTPLPHAGVYCGQQPDKLESGWLVAAGFRRGCSAAGLRGPKPLSASARNRDGHQRAQGSAHHVRGGRRPAQGQPADPQARARHGTRASACVTVPQVGQAPGHLGHAARTLLPRLAWPRLVTVVSTAVVWCHL